MNSSDKVALVALDLRNATRNGAVLPASAAQGLAAELLEAAETIHRMERALRAQDAGAARWYRAAAHGLQAPQG